jgi:hypothetical protein
MANVWMTVRENGAVVVPHGSPVVSYEDVNVDVDSDEVQLKQMKFSPVTGPTIRKKRS